MRLKEWAESVRKGLVAWPQCPSRDSQMGESRHNRKGTDTGSKYNRPDNEVFDSCYPNLLSHPHKEKLTIGSPGA